MVNVNVEEQQTVIKFYVKLGKSLKEINDKTFVTYMCIKRFLQFPMVEPLL